MIHKRTVNLLYFLGFLTMILLILTEQPPGSFSTSSWETNYSAREAAGGGNQVISGFSEAKKFLKGIYGSGSLTFYCGCRYHLGRVSQKECGYRPIKDNIRAFRVEWEHIVPAHEFGHRLRSWSRGHPDCRSNNGGIKYSGRKCARKKSRIFRFMEGDLYNLVPVIGEINEMRGSLPVGPDDFSVALIRFGSCRTWISAHQLIPRKEIRGFIARAYLYMNEAYPGAVKLTGDKIRLFRMWNERYPPDNDEFFRADQITLIQKNKNSFIEQHRKGSYAGT